MLENILIAVLSFAIGGATATTLLLVKVILPRERKIKARKRKEMETVLLLKMLAGMESKPRWKTDKKGNIISPLQQGREGS